MQWPLSQRTPSFQIQEDFLRYLSSCSTEKTCPQNLCLHPHHPESTNAFCVTCYFKLRPGAQEVTLSVCLSVPFVNSSLNLHAVSQLSFSCRSAVFQLSLNSLSFLSAYFQHSLPISPALSHYSQSMLSPNSRSAKYFVLFYFTDRST